MEEEFKVIRLRQAISVVVFKGNKFLMVSGKDWPEGAWCFPQGGLATGETHVKAVLRELKEELGTDKFQILGKSQIEHMYLFPTEKIRIKKGCEGQYQTIWFVEFIGEFNEITPDKEELMNQAWFERQDILSSMMYPEQVETFKKVLEEFDKLKESRIF